MRTILTLLIIIVGTMSVNAQTTADKAQSINNIKRDTMYIYAEATCNNIDTANYNARALLEMKVGEWVRNQHPNEGIEVCIVKAKEHFLQLETRRGSLYRAFVYVRKNDILPVSDKSEVAVFEVQTDSESSLTTSEDVISEDAPIEKPATIVLSTEEKRMLAIKNLTELNAYVKGLRDAQRLNGYGKYSTMPKDKDCHIFVCDEHGAVIASFRHQSDNTCINLSTLEIDKVENYHNGAIWFQIKEQ